jgi:Tfp pilus assembly protein PilV
MQTYEALDRAYMKRKRKPWFFSCNSSRNFLLCASKQAGFLLVEMIVALGILSLLTLVTAYYCAQIVQQRADTCRYLKMTQQARTIFEELLANPAIPVSHSYQVDDMSVVLIVHRLEAMPENFANTHSLRKRDHFFLLDLAIASAMKSGTMRTLYFTTGLSRIQESL